MKYFTYDQCRLIRLFSMSNWIIYLVSRTFECRALYLTKPSNPKLQNLPKVKILKQPNQFNYRARTNAERLQKIVEFLSQQTKGKGGKKTSLRSRLRRPGARPRLSRWLREPPGKNSQNDLLNFPNNLPLSESNSPIPFPSYSSPKFPFFSSKNPKNTEKKSTFHTPHLFPLLNMRRIDWYHFWKKTYRATQYFTIYPHFFPLKLRKIKTRITFEILELWSVQTHQTVQFVELYKIYRFQKI